MNYIWLFLLCLAVLSGILTGRIDQVTQAAFDNAKTAVEIAFGLIGIMALWLGIMKIAHEAGFIQILARAIRPVSKRLFPDVPADHPAIGAMLLNISASWLGLGNAATPFGIKAMEELQGINSQKDTASNAMIMFLALNTASITLVPMTMIALRTTLGSKNPAEIIGTTIFASAMATFGAILAVKTFLALGQGLTGFKTAILRNLRSMMGVVVILALFCIVITIAPIQTELSFTTAFKNGVIFVSRWLIPILLLIIPVLAMIKKVKVYEIFIEGAKEGFQVAIRIIPFLVAILFTVGMFRASGGMAFLIKLISPITDLIGMPAEVLPAALMRPLSGSGTLGMITELLQTHGADSFIGRLASTIYGCTETTFYVIAVYFGAVGIKKIRFAIAAGLIADAIGILAALFICRLVFL